MKPSLLIATALIAGALTALATPAVMGATSRPQVTSKEKPVKSAVDPRSILLKDRH